MVVGRSRAITIHTYATYSDIHTHTHTNMDWHTIASFYMHACRLGHGQSASIVCHCTVEASTLTPDRMPVIALPTPTVLGSENASRRAS